MGCIYIARNKINGKCYVGQTAGALVSRKKTHRQDAMRGSNQYFHKAIRKYGWEVFKWKVLVFGDDRRKLCQIEQRLICLLQTKMPDGYNASDGGEGDRNWGRMQVKRMSQYRRGRRFSEEHRRKIGEAISRWCQTKEGKRKRTKEKLRQAGLGKTISPEVRKKIGTASKRLWATKEYREKVMLARKKSKQTSLVGA